MTKRPNEEDDDALNDEDLQQAQACPTNIRMGRRLRGLLLSLHLLERTSERRDRGDYPTVDSRPELKSGQRDDDDKPNSDSTHRD